MISGDLGSGAKPVVKSKRKYLVWFIVKVDVGVLDSPLAHQASMSPLATPFPQGNVPSSVLSLRLKRLT